MIDNFLNNTCTIYQEGIINDNGVEKESLITIYSDIKCHFYSYSGGFRTTEEGINTPIFGNKVIVKGNNTLIKKGMYIDVFDPDLGEIGRFIIDLPPKVNRLYSGVIDSIELSLKNRKGA